MLQPDTHPLIEGRRLIEGGMPPTPGGRFLLP